MSPIADRPALNLVGCFGMEKYPSLVEGTGLENREVGDGAGVRIPLSPPLIFDIISRDGAAW